MLRFSEHEPQADRESKRPTQYLGVHSSSTSSEQGKSASQAQRSTQPQAGIEHCGITNHQRACGICSHCGSAACAHAANCSTTTTTTTRTITSTTTTFKPTTNSADDIDHEMEQAKANDESLGEDISQELSVEQEDKLDELSEQRGQVAAELQSLESNLELVEAAERDMQLEMDGLSDLQQHDPEAAARSRELLADEIRHDHIGRDRAVLNGAIQSAEDEGADLDEAMEAIYAGGADYADGAQDAQDREEYDGDEEDEELEVEQDNESNTYHYSSDGYDENNEGE